MLWIEVWQNPFLQNALLGLLILAPLCGLLGLHVINFRMAFFGDAVSHSAFTGVALGVLLGVHPPTAILLFALLVGLAITKVRRTTRLSLDTVIGVVHSAIIAFGIVVVTSRKELTRDFQQYLYGDILTIGTADLWQLGILALFIVAYNFFFGNQLMILSLHEELAAAHGISVRLHTYLNNLMIAAVIAVGIRAVGLLLITALLVVPAAAARNLASNVRQMFWWNMIISISSAVLGFALALRWDSSAGATIILVATGWFMVSAFGKRPRASR